MQAFGHTVPAWIQASTMCRLHGPLTTLDTPLSKMPRHGAGPPHGLAPFMPACDKPQITDVSDHLSSFVSSKCRVSRHALASAAWRAAAASSGLGSSECGLARSPTMRALASARIFDRRASVASWLCRVAMACASAAARAVALSLSSSACLLQAGLVSSLVLAAQQGKDAMLGFQLPSWRSYRCAGFETPGACTSSDRKTPVVVNSAANLACWHVQQSKQSWPHRRAAVSWSCKPCTDAASDCS